MVIPTANIFGVLKNNPLVEFSSGDKQTVQQTKTICNVAYIHVHENEVPLYLQINRFKPPKDTELNLEII